MRIKKEFWLVSAIIIFALWIVIASMAIIDLYAMQNVLIECVDIMQKLLQLLLEITGS